MSFVWFSFSHSSCTPYVSSFTLVHIYIYFPLIPLDSFVYSWQKGEECTREYTRVFRYFYMTHMHILRGRNSTSCTFVGGENRRRDAYTKGVKTLFFWENVILFRFTLCLFSRCLWCFEFCLVSMLCYSHCIMLMCWTCIYLYAIVLYLLCVQMIICFAMWSL